MLPLLVALVSIGAGLTLGLAVGPHVLGPARVVAAVASLLAVALQLVPEAVDEVGWVALLAVLGGVLVPVLLELGGRRVLRGTERAGRSDLALELAYAGLLVHQVGDGIALGALGGAAGHHHEVSLIALGVHTVALSALFVLAFRDARGRREALFRGLGMGVAVGGGAVLVALLPLAWVGVAHPWVAAATAGVLLHVAAHPMLQVLGLHGHGAHPETTVP